MFLIDEYTDYFKILVDSVYENFGLDNITEAIMLELVLVILLNTTAILNHRRVLERIFFRQRFMPLDDWKLEELEDNLISGNINLDKLASGEEIILIAPQKAAVCIVDDGNSFWDVTLLDEKIDNKFDYAVLWRV